MVVRVGEEGVEGLESFEQVFGWDLEKISTVCHEAIQIFLA
jgi:hypothetical protein